jgi:hypothetical protein
MSKKSETACIQFLLDLLISLWKSQPQSTPQLLSPEQVSHLGVLTLQLLVHEVPHTNVETIHDTFKILLTTIKQTVHEINTICHQKLHDPSLLKGIGFPGASVWVQFGPESVSFIALHSPLLHPLQFGPLLYLLLTHSLSICCTIFSLFILLFFSFFGAQVRL